MLTVKLRHKIITFNQALLSSGAIKISAYVTHAVFPKESWKLFTDCEVQFDKFYITDSIPHATAIAQHSPFKLLSLCDSISEALLGFDLLQSWLSISCTVLCTVLFRGNRITLCIGELVWGDCFVVSRMRWGTFNLRRHCRLYF